MAGWNIYKYNNGTLAWDADGEIPRANEDMSVGLVSTQVKETTADGDVAFFTPETKYNKPAIEMYWTYQDQTFKEKIETYMTNNEYLKIVTHLGSGLYTFIGRFVAFDPIWLTGVSPDAWDIRATFERME